MKYIIFLSLISSVVNGDIIIGPSIKYGVNGYSVSGTTGSSSTVSASSSNKKGKILSSSSSTQNFAGGVSVSDQTEAVVGLKIQTVPDFLGLSFGGSIYTDSTVEFSMGIRL